MEARNTLKNRLYICSNCSLVCTSIHNLSAQHISLSLSLFSLSLSLSLSFSFSLFLSLSLSLSHSRQ